MPEPTSFEYVKPSGFDYTEESEISRAARAAGGGIEFAGSMVSRIPSALLGGLGGVSSLITPGKMGDIDKARQAQEY
mgnify:CR=1 FL=1